MDHHRLSRSRDRGPVRLAAGTKPLHAVREPASPELARPVLRGRLPCGRHCHDPGPSRSGMVSYRQQQRRVTRPQIRRCRYPADFASAFRPCSPSGEPPILDVPPVVSCAARQRRNGSSAPRLSRTLHVCLCSVSARRDRSLMPRFGHQDHRISVSGMGSQASSAGLVMSGPPYHRCSAPPRTTANDRGGMRIPGQGSWLASST
jgi:hypothetical protein